MSNTISIQETPITPDGEQVGSSRLLSVDGKFANFRLKVTDRSSHTISGEIEEITSWVCDEANTPCDFKLYLTFYMKWDGCCHVWFGRKGEDDTQDGYLHLCGADFWDKHNALMRWLYQWAVHAIPMDKNVSGDLSENAIN